MRTRQQHATGMMTNKAVGRGGTFSRQPKSRVLCLSLPLLAKTSWISKQQGREVVEMLPPRPFCLEQFLATVPTSKRCRAPFSSFVTETLKLCVTAHSRKFIRSSAQDGRKMVAKPKKWDTVFAGIPLILFGAPGRNRTCSLLLRRKSVLYPMHSLGYLTT